VSDLHEVIEAGAGTDYGIAGRSSVNRRIGADFDVVFENNAPKLGNGQKAILGGCKPKPFLPDPGTRVHINACSEQRVT
jgi:hypothetical protein